MKKIYSKRQLAILIINANPGVFMPVDVLISDLTVIYKMRKVARKILNNEEYSEALLQNLVITSINIFGKDGADRLYDIVLSDEEIAAISDFLI